MAVIKGYINSMAISRELYLKKWERTLQNIDDIKNAVARNHAIKQYKVWHCIERRKLTIKYVGTL